MSLDPLASALFENSSLFSYFAGLVFNNLNERSAPTKGMSWAVSYHLYTDNLFQYKDNNPISVFDVRWQGCFSPSRTAADIPDCSRRCKGLHESSATRSSASATDFRSRRRAECPGRGTIPPRGLYATADTVYGHHRAELSQAALLVAGLNLRQRILKNQYISVMGSYGRNSGKFHQILDSSESVDMAGGGIGYM